MSGAEQDPTKDTQDPPLLWIGKLIGLSPFDEDAWTKGNLREKMRIGALSWVDHGFGAPATSYLFYILKHAFWFAMWRFFAGYGPDKQLWGSGDALQRLVLWNLLFEVTGMGCASGPLTGKFLTPFTAIFHWLWVGSMKLPYRLNLRDDKTPLVPFAGTTRTPGDVFFFLLFCGSVLRALTSPSIGFSECAPVVVLLTGLGLFDVTMWLAARSEVYLYMTVCFMFADGASNESMWTALKLIQIGIWFWAGVSKLGPWFQFTIQVMICNCMVWPFSNKALHPAFFRKHPSDLRTSQLCRLVSHFGAVNEFVIPALLACGGAAGYLSPEGSLMGKLGLFIACGFHSFIIIQVAMGAPQEWNLFTIINSLSLFGLRGGVSLSQLAALPTALKLFLLWGELLVPLLGNFKPQYVSFLPCMRYYAGNWPVSIWLIKKTASHKLSRVKSASGSMSDQLWSLHGSKGVKFGQAKLLAWLSMHCQGRLLPKLYPLALPGGADAVNDYQVNLGEMFAALALGYNFGDGYLHGSFLLNEIQKKCVFEKGELVQIFIDSCPLGGSEYPWWIRDATDAYNPLHSGAGSVDQLVESQPF